MSAPPTNPLEFGWPWTVRFAPERLWQSIDQGWTFGNVIVNNENSPAPYVERAVVQRYSYGQQIDRLSQALTALIEHVPAAKNDQRIKDFEKLAKAIDTIKSGAHADRLEQLKRELDALKKNHAQEWEDLMAGQQNAPRAKSASR